MECDQRPLFNFFKLKFIIFSFRVPKKLGYFRLFYWLVLAIEFPFEFFFFFKKKIKIIEKVMNWWSFLG